MILVKSKPFREIFTFVKTSVKAFTFSQPTAVTSVNFMGQISEIERRKLNKFEMWFFNWQCEVWTYANFDYLYRLTHQSHQCVFT